MLIEPAKANAYFAKVESAMSRITSSDFKQVSDMEKIMEMIFGKKPMMMKAKNVAYIPVKGVIGSDLTAIETMMGSVDVSDIEEMLEEAEADDAIEHIVMDFNSPGGSVTGVPELGRKIKNSKKHTIGYTGSQSCSGSYWLMSQCDEAYCTESSDVGSIGVYKMVMNMRKAYEMEGYHIDMIKSGWAKAAGYPGTDMTAEQRKLMEEDVAEVHHWFIEAVKSVRTMADEADMQGQVWNGRKAAEKMLVSGIVDGIDDVFKMLGVEAEFEAMEDGHEIGSKHGLKVESEEKDGEQEEKKHKMKKKSKKKKKEDDEMEEAEDAEADDADDADEGEADDGEAEIDEADLEDVKPIDTDPHKKKK